MTGTEGPESAPAMLLSYSHNESSKKTNLDKGSGLCYYIAER